MDWFSNVVKAIGVWLNASPLRLTLVPATCALAIGIIIAIVIYKMSASRKHANRIDAQVRALDEKFGHMCVYLDGLLTSRRRIRTSIEAGIAAMEAYNWDEAIAQFREAIKLASGTQLAALYNFIGLCHYTPARWGKSLEAFEESRRLSMDFGDREGEAAALSNMGSTYLNKGELDAALQHF